MLVIKGRYNGEIVVLESIPPIKECEVTVNFPDIPVSVEPIAPQPRLTSGKGPGPDDGSLAYLFRDYVDDGIREPVVDFGSAVGNEKW